MLFEYHKSLQKVVEILPRRVLYVSVDLVLDIQYWRPAEQLQAITSFIHGKDTKDTFVALSQLCSFTMIVVYINTTQAAQTWHYCSQVHMTNFGDIIKLLAPVLLMRILILLTWPEPFSCPNIKEKSGLASEITAG